MNELATSVGRHFYKPKSKLKLNDSGPLGKTTTTASVFAPMQLERRVLLWMLPVMIAAVIAIWIDSVVNGAATFVETYQLGPLTAIMIALYLWILRSRPARIHKPRNALIAVICLIVFERFAVGLWYTATGGYDPHVMRDMLPWMILGSMLCILLIPGRLGMIFAFVNYGANSIALIIFLPFAPRVLDTTTTFDLAVTHLAGHLLVVVGMVVFARLRVAYGKALARSEDLELLALEDALTGIYNRRAFTLAFKRARARAQRTDRPMSLLLIDVDHFKSVNDDLGHSVGDHALRALAGLLLSELRDTDEVFRCGGEEFLILLEETSLQSAWEVGERVRKHVKTSDLIHERRLTVSIGVAELAEFESEHGIFSRADTALYEAKSKGRDQVCVALPPKEETLMELK